MGVWEKVIIKRKETEISVRGGTVKKLFVQRLRLSIQSGNNKRKIHQVTVPVRPMSRQMSDASRRGIRIHRYVIILGGGSM
jgi:hypothetical protein